MIRNGGTHLLKFCHHSFPLCLFVFLSFSIHLCNTLSLHHFLFSFTSFVFLYTLSYTAQCTWNIMLSQCYSLWLFSRWSPLQRWPMAHYTLEYSVCLVYTKSVYQLLCIQKVYTNFCVYCIQKHTKVYAFVCHPKLVS